MFASLKLPLATAEATRRQHLPSTFTEPLHVSQGRQEELKEFLADFYHTIYQKRNELVQLLEENATLQAQYQTLVVEQRAVAHEDFWQRYFWKCNAHRILAEWQAKDQERAAARSEYIADGLARVQKLIHHDTARAEADDETTTSTGDAMASPRHDDAVDDFLETKKGKTDGVDDFLDSGPVEGEEPLVFWNKEENVPKDPGRPPRAKKNDTRKSPKRVPFAEDESTSINNERDIVEKGTDKMRKEPSANQAVVSEEPVTVVQRSKQEDKSKPAAAVKTPYASSDDNKCVVDYSVSAGENSSTDIDASNDENRDEAKSKTSEEEKCNQGPKPRTVMADTLTNHETLISKKSEMVKEEELVITEISDTTLDDSGQTSERSTTDKAKKESSVNISPTKLGGSNANKAVSSDEKALSSAKADKDNGDKMPPVSMESNDPKVKSKKQKASQQVKVTVPIANQSEERRKAQTLPSTTASTLISKVGASSIESSKLKSSPIKARETNKSGRSTDDSSTATSKMHKKKGSKVNEIKSMFESASTDAKRSNRTMGSPSRNASVAKSLPEAPVLRSWNRDQASPKGSTKPSMRDVNDQTGTSVESVGALSDSKKGDPPSSKKQSSGTRRKPMAMFRAWNKSRNTKKGNEIDDIDTSIKNVPQGEKGEKPLEASKNPRSILINDPPKKVHFENVDKSKDDEATEASKHMVGSLERSTSKLKWTIVASAVLAVITIGLFIPSSTFRDGLCAPAFPSYKLTSSDTNVYLESPWWAPLSYKTRLFPVVCGKDRMRTVVEWVPFDHKKKADHHRLVIRGLEEAKMEVIHREKKKLSSVSIYARKIVTVDQHGSTHEIPAPWMLDAIA